MTSRHVTLHCVRRHGRVDISRLSRIDLMVYLLLRKSIAKSRHPSLPYSLRHNIDNLYILLLHTYIIASTIGNGAHVWKSPVGNVDSLGGWSECVWLNCTSLLLLLVGWWRWGYCRILADSLLSSQANIIAIWLATTEIKQAVALWIEQCMAIIV